MNFQQALAAFLNRPSKAGATASAFNQSLARAQQNRMLIAQEKAAQRRHRLDILKAQLEERKADAELEQKKLEAFHKQGINTAAALERSVEIMKRTNSPRGRFKAITDLKELQNQGLISADVELDLADSLTTDGKELTDRFASQAKQFRESFEKGLTFEQRKELAEAGKSEQNINVDARSGLTEGAKTQTQGAVRSARTELKNLREVNKLLDSPQGRRLFTLAGKFEQGVAKIKDALDASNPEDKAILDTLQTAQQGARFAALAILNRFSGKQLTDKEREFVLNATGNPDDLSPTEIRVGLRLIEKKLAQAQLDDVATLSGEALDLKTIKEEAEGSLKGAKPKTDTHSPTKDLPKGGVDTDRQAVQDRIKALREKLKNRRAGAPDG